ncbi:MAG: hypothetical protein ACKVKG_08635, partial [Alphaproteobacteria bacterium]
GKSHGFVIGVVDAFQNIGALAGKTKITNLKKIEPDLSIGIWFERRDEDGDGKDDETGRCLGFTATVGAAAGWDAGGSYIAATTVQFCTNDMKCTEGVWTGDVGGREMTIHVDGQNKKFIYARKNGGSREKFKRVLPAGRKYKSASGDIVPNSANARPSTTKFNRSKVIDTRGLWDFEANGKVLTDEFVRQTSDFVELRRLGGRKIRRYEKVGENIYQNARGSIFRFVTRNRALWISPDKKTVYKLQKR